MQGCVLFLCRTLRRDQIFLSLLLWAQSGRIQYICDIRDGFHLRTALCHSLLTIVVIVVGLDRIVDALIVCSIYILELLE